MLKEEKSLNSLLYRNLLTYCFMFVSFFILSLFVYVLHIVQAGILYRTYVTAFALICCGFGMSQKQDLRCVYLWASACVWFVYSIIYFDIRTHISSFYWLWVLGFALFPFLSWRRLYDSPRLGVVYRMLYWLYIFFTPSMHGNIYGNALYSIIKLLSVVLLILTDERKVKRVEYYSWALFCHEILLLLVPFQIMYNVLPMFGARVAEVPMVEKTRVGNDIIGHKDVPFLFNRKSSV